MKSYTKALLRFNIFLIALSLPLPLHAQRPRYATPQQLLQPVSFLKVSRHAQKKIYTQYLKKSFTNIQYGCYGPLHYPKTIRTVALIIAAFIAVPSAIVCFLIHEKLYGTKKAKILLDLRKDFLKNMLFIYKTLLITTAVCLLSALIITLFITQKYYFLTDQGILLINRKGAHFTPYKSIISLHLIHIPPPFEFDEETVIIDPIGRNFYRITTSDGETYDYAVTDFVSEDAYQNFFQRLKEKLAPPPPPPADDDDDEEFEII